MTLTFEEYCQLIAIAIRSVQKTEAPPSSAVRRNTYVRTGPDGRPVYARAWPVDQPTATLTTTRLARPS